MENIISQMTTQTEIKNYLSYLNASRNVCFEQIHRRVKQTSNHKLFLDHVQSIRLSDHAVERWNERVGPSVIEDNLLGILNSLLLVPGAITLINKEEGRIGDDIVFTYFIEEEQMVITTFYGRISLHPALNNLNSLKRFNSCKHDTYNLGVPQETLNRQPLPFIPKEVISYNGSKNVYLIEKYVNEDAESCLFLYKISSGHITRTVKIDPKKPECSLLTRKTLFILYRLGYVDFVLEHLTFHKPENVKAIRIQSFLKEIVHPTTNSFFIASLPFGLIPFAPALGSVESVGLVKAS